jgi:predicted RNase H-like HicB family nuclease
MICRGERSGYVAECLELTVVTQGATLDEVVQNLQEAVALHLEGEDLQETTRYQVQLGDACREALLQKC